MPGWGTGSFENEHAQSFLARLNSLEIGDLRPILARAADQEDYLEAPESSMAIAAAEVVAVLVVSARGVAVEDGVRPAGPRELVNWASKDESGAPPDLVYLARRAVERVRTNSELKDLWLEAEGLNEWSAALRELEGRLR